MGKWVGILSVVLFALLFAACSSTRHIPQGEYLLKKVKVQEDKDAPKKERVTGKDIQKYIRQSPNSSFLGMKVGLWLYNFAKPGSDSWWNRQWRKIGSEPVILDTVETARSVSNVRNYLENIGFLDAEVTSRVDTARKKAKLTYIIDQNEPFRIDSLYYDFLDQAIEPVVMDQNAKQLIVPGNILDFSVLDAERKRIASYLSTKGYYDFTINSIYYEVDTTKGNYKADVTMVIKQFQDGTDKAGEPVFENNPVYRIRSFDLYSAYDPTKAATDALYNSDLDTVDYRSLNIIYLDKLLVRPSILRRGVPLYPNSLYNSDLVTETYNKLMWLGYYRSVNIRFTPAESPDGEANSVTYIDRHSGAVNPGMSAPEKYLDCEILCVPGTRQSYTIDLEGGTTSSYNSLTFGIGYQNRNLFRGVELFNVNFRSGLEFMRVTEKVAYDIGGSVSVSIPRFLLPKSINRYNRVPNPRTKFEVSVDVQRKPIYRRTLTNASLGYSWGNKKNTINYVVRPIDVNLINVPYIDKLFEQQIEDDYPYLRDSYRSKIVAGISGGLVFNSAPPQSNVNNVTVRFAWETNGNFLRLISPWMLPRNAKGEYELFKTAYAQYAMANLSVSNKIVTGPQTSINYRLWGGYGFTYGNSRNGSIPQNRLFYAGGSNSMRGWQVRTLGPGGDPYKITTYPSQVGDIKLEANLEFRFPMIGFLKGAIFTDVGNVWLSGVKKNENPAGVFHFDTFYKQLAADVGYGFRLDFNFFLVRFDWGVPIHDPGKPVGDRWIHRFRVKDTALTFGVGLPF